MKQAKIVTRFNTLSLGDSLLQVMELRTGEAECRLRFDAGRVLKGEGASIFEPEAEFAPALLRLCGVRSVSCDGGLYQLNSTVVDFGAVLSKDPEYIEFYFDLTGGTDPDAFMIRVKFVAKDFVFGAWEEVSAR